MQSLENYIAGLFALAAVLLASDGERAEQLYDLHVDLAVRLGTMSRKKAIKLAYHVARVRLS